MVRKVQIVLSDKLFYTILAVITLILICAGVYAYSGNIGHTSDQIDEVDPTVASSVKDGISWTEISSRPSGLDNGDDNTWRPCWSCSCPCGTCWATQHYQYQIYDYWRMCTPTGWKQTSQNTWGVSPY